MDASGAERIGQAHTADGAGVELSDIAAHDGEVYASSYDALFKVDPDTATVSLIGALQMTDANALEFSADGTLFAASYGGQLGEISPTDASILSNFQIPNGLVSSGDMAQAGDGALWLIGSTPDIDSGQETPEQLLRMDPDTRSVEPVGPPFEGASSFTGLSVDDNGDLLGFALRSPECPQGGGLYQLTAGEAAIKFDSCLPYLPRGATAPTRI